MQDHEDRIVIDNSRPQGVWADDSIRRTSFWWVSTAFVACLIAAFTLWAVPTVADWFHFASAEATGFAAWGNRVVYGFAVPIVFALGLARSLIVYEAIRADVWGERVLLRRFGWLTAVVATFYITHLAGTWLSSLVNGALNHIFETV